MKKYLLLAALMFAFTGNGFAQLDTTKWYATGNMFQNTTNDWCLDPANVVVSGGFMTQTILSGSFTCQGHTAVPYSSGEILSKNFWFTYGVVKARIRFGNPGNTLTSAVWMWGGDTTSSGYPPTCIATIEASTGTNMLNCTTSAVTSYEIDILENDSNSGTNWNNWLEWQSGAIASQSLMPVSQTPPTNTGYHIYELDWTPTQLIYKTDGVVTNTATVSFPFPMFLLIDQELKFLPTSTPNTTSVD